MGSPCEEGQKDSEQVSAPHGGTWGLQALLTGSHPFPNLVPPANKDALGVPERGGWGPQIAPELEGG